MSDTLFSIYHIKQIYNFFFLKPSQTGIYITGQTCERVKRSEYNKHNGKKSINNILSLSLSTLSPPRRHRRVGGAVDGVAVDRRGVRAAREAHVRELGGSPRAGGGGGAQQAASGRGGASSCVARLQLRQADVAHRARRERHARVHHRTTVVSEARSPRDYRRVSDSQSRYH